MKTTTIKLSITVDISFDEEYWNGNLLFDAFQEELDCHTEKLKIEDNYGITVLSVSCANSEFYE